jgi:NitT/TauT family transport system permease protein/taurine transport system permease protein
MAKVRPLVSPSALRLLVLSALLAAWEALPRLGMIPKVLIAPPSATFAVGFTEYAVFARALAVTMGEIALGLVIAYGLGGLIGLVLGSVRSLQRTVLPLVGSLYAVPLVVIYPLLTAWIGIGPGSKVIFAGVYGLFPMVLATAAGMQMIDVTLIRAARSMGATRAQILLQILVPAAFPAILSGLRLGGALVTIGVIVAEMMAATDGIGFLITQNRTMFKTPEVYFGIFLAIVIAGMIDWSIGLIERRFAVWQPRKVSP